MDENIIFHHGNGQFIRLADLVISLLRDDHGDHLARAGISLHVACHQVVTQAHFHIAHVLDGGAHPQLEADVSRGKAFLVNLVRHYVADIITSEKRDVPHFFGSFAHGKFGGGLSGGKTGFGHPIDQVVDMHHIAGGKMPGTLSRNDHLHRDQQ